MLIGMTPSQFCARHKYSVLWRPRERWNWVVYISSFGDIIQLFSVTV